MKEFTYSFKEALGKGLKPTPTIPRDVPVLLECVGAFPWNGSLVVGSELLRTALGSLPAVSFPYPQIFSLRNCIIVGTKDALYEYAAGAVTSKISGLAEGLPWTVADFGVYLIFTNGKVTVTRDDNGAWTINSTLPIGSSICAVGGQAVLGGQTVPLANIDEVGFQVAGSLAAKATIGES